MQRPHAYVFAGNHGVTARGVSAFPSEVTVQMVANFEHGGAAINQLCKTFGIELNVLALDLENPTDDFTDQPAMSEDDCVDAFARGMAVVSDGMDVLCLGEMGIGNTTSAAAICHGLYGGDAADWTGPGTGVQGEAMAAKTRVVGQAVDHHKNTVKDGLDVLCALGGRELAAIAGAVLAARLKRVPVLLDGYVSSAAAAVLEATTPGALDHCLVGHASTEPGHLRLLDKINKNRDKIIRFEEDSTDGADVVVLTYGITARVARAGIDVARKQGVKVGSIRLIVIWPFPEQRIRDLAGQVKAFVVPEINAGQIVLEVERCAAGNCPAIHVPHLGGGVHNPRDIAKAIVEAAK